MLRTTFPIIVLSYRDDSDAKEMIKLAEDLLTQVDTSQLQTRVTSDTLDHTMLRQLSYTARGVLAPLCACVGGVIAQETLKALTGKYMPINQWVCEAIQIIRFWVNSFIGFISYSLMHLNC